VNGYEQGNLYNQQATNINNYPSNGNSAWRAIRSATIPTMLCPSDGNNGIVMTRYGGNWARGNYAANAGPEFWTQGANGASANGTPPGGASWSGRGPFYPITNMTMVGSGGSGMKIQTIQDGSSNTIMLAEIRTNSVASDPRGVWAIGTPGSSIVAGYAQGDAQTINARNSGADDVLNCSNTTAIGMGCCTGCTSNQATIRSQHTNGANVTFADGSVRFLTDSLPARTLWLLGSAQDGQAIPNF
jgi:prepilin-type processing-associated H-X9-DG protein